MEELRKIIESELGKVGDSEFKFSIEQFRRNSIQVGDRDRDIFTPAGLDEIANNIEFYRRYYNVFEDNGVCKEVSCVKSHK